MEYTLVQVAVFMDSLVRRKRQEAAFQISVLRVSHHGEKADVEGFLKELS